MRSSISLASISGESALPDPIVREDSLVAYSGPSGSLADIMTEGVDPGFNSDDITTYTVVNGDTLSSIATKFNISLNTIRWQNNIKKGEQVKPGQQLIILPTDGVMVRVTKGDTLQKIAARYSKPGTSKEELASVVRDIKEFNDIEGDKDLVAGSKIVVPGGEQFETQKSTTKQTSTKSKKKNPIVIMSGRPSIGGYIDPTMGKGILTQGSHTPRHAIDVGIRYVPLYAARSGVVTIASDSGYGGGFGYYVVIRHSDGAQTLYAHMSQVDVKVGQSVEQGETIGISGNTGRSTGPHLHFEIRTDPNGTLATDIIPLL
jgi:LysM repeat protein